MSKSKKFKIFIDPGHNDKGPDTGAVGNGLREQDITFAIAHLLAKMFPDSVETKLSRPTKDTILGTDLSTSLTKRAQLANAWGADLFIAIHTNAHTDASANGTEVWSFTGENDNDVLALEVCTALCKALGTTHRGEKDASFAVLRQTNMNAILIETAFITNPSDAEKLKTKQNVIAKAIADAVIRHYNLQKTVKELTDANDILWELMNGALKVEILDTTRALKHLEEAQKENSSLYWILRKIVNS